MTSASLVFTKIVKPIVNWLRARNAKIVVYLDDFLIFGKTIQECLEFLHLTANLLTYLGFIINWKKSEVKPSRLCKFLGMNINSSNMTLELPMDNRLKIKQLLESFFHESKVKIQESAEPIGVLVAACPAIAYGWMYCKELELIKRNALQLNRGNMSKRIDSSVGAISEIKWSHSHIFSSNNKIRTSNFDMEIFTDASTTGWGAVCHTERAHGLWGKSERERHINYLEIKAAFLGLKTFAKNSFDVQILMRIDNVTALAYINKMGRTKYRSLHNLTKEIWEWCMERRIWIFAEYIASKENLADEGSRLSNLDTEWELANYAFEQICSTFGKPTIDLFATRINNKCKKYCSWERDPEAHAINSLTISWKDEFWYAFPPSH